MIYSFWILEELGFFGDLHSLGLIEQDLFEATYNELRKWVDEMSLKYGTIPIIHERHSERLGSALKVCLVNDSYVNIN